MESAEVQRQLASLGKGLVQVNLRLARITDLIEQQGSATPGHVDAVGEGLFDLLDAVERTLHAAALPVPVVPWWQAMLGVKPPPPLDLAGLALARDQAVQQLADANVRRTAGEGAVDLRLHRVVDVVPTDDPARGGTIATTHLTGWHREGHPPTVIRVAHVTAWRHRES